MFNRWFHPQAHHYLALTGLAIIAVGLSFSNVAMSVGTIWIISNVVLEGDYRSAWIRLKNNRWFIWACLIFSLHFIWLIGTSDFSYGFHDIKIKLPLLVIPLALAARPRNAENEIHIVFTFFIGGVILASIYNYLYFYKFIPNDTVMEDVRSMSRFVSHIRFSFMIVFAFFICIYFLIKKIYSPLPIIIIALWLLFYAVVSQIMSGFIVLVVILVFSTIYTAFFVKNKILKRAAVLLGVAILILLIFLVYDINQWKKTYTQPVDVVLLDTTKAGNKYTHDSASEIRENGYLVYANVCETELREKWSRVSSVHFDSLNSRGFPLNHSLIHYMASKGLNKDAEGFKKLNDSDIDAIEKGYSNYLMTRNDIRSKLFVLWSDWMNNEKRDPNGSSLLQRREHLKIASLIIKDNWFLGVGTGDVQDKFYEYYQKNGSLLKIENQNRAHNQFLTFWISFGITGLVLLLLYITIPVFYFKKEANYLVPIFLVLSFLTFMMEDMLETQAGVTFFAFFFNLLLIRKRDPQ